MKHKNKCALCGKRELSFKADDVYCSRCDKIAGDVLADLIAEFKDESTIA